MVLPLLAFFVYGGTLSGVPTSLDAFVPILLCLGARGVMFLLMGASYYGNRKTSDETIATTNSLRMKGS